jgi:L-asparagine oxygenase
MRETYLMEHALDTYHDYILELTDEESSFCKALLEGLPQTNAGCSWEDSLITEIELRTRLFSDHLLRPLIQFRKHSNENGMLLIRNIPVDSVLPPTPPDGRISLEKNSHMSEYMLLAIMLQLGEPIAYEDEKNGALIQNICPVRGKEEAQENIGSTYLEFHTEDAFHPYKPDFVGLLCLRPDHDGVAVTAAASIRKALSMVPSKVQDLLRQPLYHIRFSSSFIPGNTGEVAFSPHLPVLSGDILEPEMNVDFYGMEAITPAAQLALKTLEDALLKVAVEVKLKKGELMIIDNRVAAHARTAFHPRYDGKDRWLQRLFVVHDFRRSRASRAYGSHICTPLPIEFFRMDLDKQKKV